MLGRVRQLLGEGRFAKSVSVLAGGTALAQVIMLAGSPAISRLFDPGEMGVFGLHSAFLALGSGVLSLRYDAAVVAVADDEEARVLAWLAFALLVPTGILASGALASLARLDLLGFGVFSPATIAVTSAGMILTGAFFVLRFWLLRYEAIGGLSSIAVVQGAGRTLGPIAAGAAGMGTVGLILGDVAGRFLGLGQALRRSWHSLGLRRPSLAQIREVSRRYREFPMFGAPSTLLNSLALALPLPLVANSFGVEAAGQFFLVQRVFAVPSALIARSVGDVFHGRFAGLVRAGSTGAVSLFRRVSLGLLLIGVIPTALLLFGGDYLFPLVFGRSWVLAGSLAAVAAPWFLAGFVVSPMSRLVLVVGGQNVKLIYDALSLLGVVAVFLWASRANADVRVTIGVLSVVQTAAYIVYFAMLARLSRRARPRGGLTGNREE